MNSHKKGILPELTECEFRLRSVIEGVDEDKILVRFTHIDNSDPQREFSLVLDVSGPSYKGIFLTRVLNHLTHLMFAVPTTTPFLPNLPILLDELNENQDIYAFIKRVRHEFEELVTR